MTGWTAIVPVKPSRLGKHRLDLQPRDRERLARAFSLDVLDVVTSAPSIDLVVVVTAEPQLGAIARRRGATVVVDRPLLASDGLNRAIVDGRHWAQAKAPGAPVVVLPGDLAALDVASLEQALTVLSASSRAFVPDLSGTGTTLLAAARPSDLDPCFGDQSAHRHAAAGYWAAPDVDHRCRLDVDTTLDLLAAHRLGVGRHTAAALDHVDVTTRTPIVRPKAMPSDTSRWATAPATI